MKVVRIPDNMVPWRCRINGVDYEYPAGEIKEVPDAVAAVIAAYNAAQRETAESNSSASFTVAPIRRTENGVENREYWFLANARWNQERRRFQRIDLDKNSFGIQIQAAGTYPGEAALGYTNNQAIGYWRAIGRETFLAAGDKTSAAAVTEDIGAEAGGEWKSFGVYLGWNNCQMLDSYGGMTIGGQGFEIDGNGLYPYARVSYCRHEDVAGADGYAMLGLLWNAYHGLSGSDDEATADYALGLKAPIDYGDEESYNAASNTVDMSKASFVIMRRAAGAAHTAAEFRPIYELDMAGKLHVSLGGEIALEATVIDDTSAQVLYTGALTQANTQVRRIVAETAEGEVGLTLGNVTKTQYGAVFGYSGASKDSILSMTAYVINTDKDFDIKLDDLAKLEARVAALEAAGGST